MPYFEKITRSGRLLEVERYFATRDGRRIARGENRAESSEEMERLNERNARRKLMRLINANFSGAAGDLFVTLTHAQPVDEAQAAKEERNVLLRIARARERKGLDALKYIAITECQSGRWHHHLIINGGLTLDELRAVWGTRGRLMVSTLDDTYTYEELARYLTRGHKPRRGAEGAENAKTPRRKGARRWHASRNLTRPVETKRQIARPPKPGEPKARKGYRLLPDWYVGCDRLGYVYSYAAYVAEQLPAGFAEHLPVNVPNRRVNRRLCKIVAAEMRHQIRHFARMPKRFSTDQRDQRIRQEVNHGTDCLMGIKRHLVYGCLAPPGQIAAPDLHDQPVFFTDLPGADAERHFQRN